MGVIEKDTGRNFRLFKGLAVQQGIFGEETVNTMRISASEELTQIQDYLSAYCFGDVYTRDIPDVKMRERITFCEFIPLVVGNHRQMQTLTLVQT